MEFGAYCVRVYGLRPTALGCWDFEFRIYGMVFRLRCFGSVSVRGFELWGCSTGFGGLRWHTCLPNRRDPQTLHAGSKP